MPESEKVHVIGAVVNAEIFLLDEPDTVSTMIDKAGGLSANVNGNGRLCLSGKVSRFCGSRHVTVLESKNLRAAIFLE